MPRRIDPELRPRLLDAATTELAVSGYAVATLDRVASRAGVTKGGVYFHFRGKEELLFAVVDHWLERLRAETANAGGRTAGDRLGAFLASWLRFHFLHPEAAAVLRLLDTELQGRFTTQLRDDRRSMLRNLRQQIRELLVEGAADGSLFTDDPALSAFLLAGSIEGIVAQWIAAPRDAEPFLDAEALARRLLLPLATGRRRRPAPPRREAEGEAFQPPF